MARRSSATSRPVLATALGLGAALVVAGAHWAGLDARVELLTLDQRFRRFATAPVPEAILRVEIDDASLEKSGWPWPREQIAGLAEVLLESGAKIVALDIIMPEAQKVRYESEEAEVYADHAGPLVGTGGPIPVFDDLILTETIRKNPERVFLPMYISLGQDPKTPVEAELRRRVATRPAVSSVALREELAAERWQGVEKKDLEKESFVRAYLRARALAAIESVGIPLLLAGDYPLRSGAIVPPLASFAQASRHTGFVTVDPDPDGAVRRIPLLIRDAGRAYPQFALSLAAKELGRQHGGAASIAADASAVTLRCADGFARVIPVDREGCLLINWVPRRAGGTSRGRIPASAVVDAWTMKKDIERLHRVWRSECLRIAKIVYTLDEAQRHPLFELYAKADELHEKRIQAEPEYFKAILFDPEHVPPPPTELRAAEKRLEAELDEKCAELLADLRDPENLEFFLEGRPDYEAKKRGVQGGLRLLAHISEMRRGVERDLAERRKRLRPLIDGKICLVGSTATGAADFVVTPIHRRTPGVEVHANILNTILSGAFVRRAHPVSEAMVILLAGLAVTILATWRSALHSAPATALLIVGYIAFNVLVVFHLWDVWLVLVAPVGAMIASFLVVTAYRQLTEERARRHIRRLFAHALSPVLVDRMVENPSLMKLGGERRILSCYFSDLAKFTSISERLGEQETVKLLNHYFDHMTDVIQNRHGGYLNKFLGDGILALFGAPVFLTDHAARAIRTALDCHREIERLNVELAAEGPGAPKIVCRIGIATGEVMVGNCGSTDRMDYTAIGPTVNLAARLESANKFFGSATLVDGETWGRADAGDVLARPMGRIVVVGMHEPVGILNPIAYAADAPDAQKRLVEDFSRAVDRFTARDFAGAMERFAAVLKAHPGDEPSRVYLDLSRQYAAAPPPDDWDGSLVLTEK